MFRGLPVSATSGSQPVPSVPPRRWVFKAASLEALKTSLSTLPAEGQPLTPPGSLASIATGKCGGADRDWRAYRRHDFALVALGVASFNRWRLPTRDAPIRCERACTGRRASPPNRATRQIRRSGLRVGSINGPIRPHRPARGERTVYVSACQEGGMGTHPAERRIGPLPYG